MLRPLAPASRPGSVTPLRVRRCNGSETRLERDWVVTEEPLEIRLIHGPAERARTDRFLVTLRTPGQDFELVAGLLFAEGVIRAAEELESLAYCVEEVQRYNVVNARLRPGVRLEMERLTRAWPVTASCGLCGVASLEALERQGYAPLAPGPRVAASWIQTLPARMREAQDLFARTGGLHAAGLFEAGGALRWLREDVGRHNALDKAIGRALLRGELPLSSSVLLLSGRVSFELVQKALAAGIPIVAAVGAPSSLAVQLARRFQLTLLGFVSAERFNVYSGAARIAPDHPPPSPTRQSGQ